VRQDIVTLLQLREPACYVASFNRPNLAYRVLAKSRPYEQVLEFVRARPKESGIVYCQARKTADSLAQRLDENGIKARPYHAGLTSAERTKHQELFLRDEARVICATIAFGMGINKPNVRFVLHHDLPKNIEGYYQETGRAGRDGLPAECVLLFSAGDVVKQMGFIDEKPEPKEQEIARVQLRQMVHYAECSGCRRAELLAYFGETFEEDNCGGCDNCLSPRQTYDGTIAAQKLLSCVYRTREKTRFGVGLNHIIEILTGADTEKVRRWGHHQLSTYGIGGEHTRSEWGAIGRELIRLGYLGQTSDKFSVIELTPEGLAALKQRRRITLTKPVSTPDRKTRLAGDIACDESLFERLRQLRKALADQQGVPPYIVFSDVSLRQMARDYPADERDFARISGVGEKKLHEFGAAFLAEIAAHLQTHPRQIFAEDSFAAPRPAPGRAGLGGTVRETLRLFRAGQSIEQIAHQRLLTAGTVCTHLVEAVEAGEPLDLSPFFTAEQKREVAAAFDKLGMAGLTEVFESLGGRYDYHRLRLARAAIRARQARARAG
jgi:ATP-dependent DNA helicase RecQ